MPPLGYRPFVNGDTLEADDINGFLLQQALTVHASEADRDTAITTPFDGMATVLTAERRIELRIDGEWWPLPGLVQHAAGTQAIDGGSRLELVYDAQFPTGGTVIILADIVGNIGSGGGPRQIAARNVNRTRALLDIADGDGTDSTPFSQVDYHYQATWHA